MEATKTRANRNAPVPKSFRRLQMLVQRSGKLGHVVFLQMPICVYFLFILEGLMSTQLGSWAVRVTNRVSPLLDHEQNPAVMVLVLVSEDMLCKQKEHQGWNRRDATHPSCKTTEEKYTKYKDTLHIDGTEARLRQR